MTLVYPLGSGVLRARTADTPPFDSSCFNTRSTIENFSTDFVNRIALSGSPDTTIQTAWGTPPLALGNVSTSGSWYSSVGGATYPLVFPGTPFQTVPTYGPTTPWHAKISPSVPYNFWAGEQPYVVRFTQAPNVVGLIGLQSASTFDQFDRYGRPTTGISYEFRATFGYNEPQFVLFDAEDIAYHPELTGAGTLTVPRGVATGVGPSDYIRIGTVAGKGELHIEDTGDWGTHLAGNGGFDAPLTAAWNRDIVRVRFIFKFNRLASPTTWVDFTVGDNTLRVSPGNYVTLTTAGGSNTGTGADLVANTYYNAEIDINLIDGLIRARIYPNGSATTGWLSANSGGERWNDGTYLPQLNIATHSESGGQWHLTFDQIEADIATTGPFAPGEANGANLYIFIHDSSTNNGDLYGAYRAWPSADPGDGRAYATTWEDEAELRGQYNNPQVGVGVVWGLSFGDPGAYGIGAFLTYQSYISSYALPANEPAVFGGGPFDIQKWEVHASGEIGLSIGGHLIESWPGFTQGTGEIDNLLVTIKSYNFGEGAVYWYDYSALGGSEGIYSLSAKCDQPTQWVPFTMKFQNHGSGGGLSNGSASGHLQWGIEVLDNNGGLDKLRQAGPLTAGFFLPNWGSFGVGTRKVNIYLTRNGLDLQIFPCTPPAAGTIVTETH